MSMRSMMARFAAGPPGRARSVTGPGGRAYLVSRSRKRGRRGRARKNLRRRGQGNSLANTKRPERLASASPKMQRDFRRDRLSLSAGPHVDSHQCPRMIRRLDRESDEKRGDAGCPRLLWSLPATGPAHQRRDRGGPEIIALQGYDGGRRPAVGQCCEANAGRKTKQARGLCHEYRPNLTIVGVRRNCVAVTDSDPRSRRDPPAY